MNNQEIRCPNNDCMTPFIETDLLVVGKGNKVTCENCGLNYEVDIEYVLSTTVRMPKATAEGSTLVKMDSSIEDIKAAILSATAGADMCRTSGGAHPVIAVSKQPSTNDDFNIIYYHSNRYDSCDAVDGEMYLYRYGRLVTSHQAVIYAGTITDRCMPSKACYSETAKWIIESLDVLAKRVINALGARR